MLARVNSRDRSSRPLSGHPPLDGPHGASTGKLQPGRHNSIVEEDADEADGIDRCYPSAPDDAHQIGERQRRWRAPQAAAVKFPVTRARG